MTPNELYPAFRLLADPPAVMTDEYAKLIQEQERLKRRAADESDDAPADFEWLAAQCEMHKRPIDIGYECDVWWECGCVSFSCEAYQPDPGEPVETVASEWQVDGETLPRALLPETRGEFRTLCRLANKGAQ